MAINQSIDTKEKFIELATSIAMRRLLREQKRQRRTPEASSSDQQALVAEFNTLQSTFKTILAGVNKEIDRGTRYPRNSYGHLLTVDALDIEGNNIEYMNMRLFCSDDLGKRTKLLIGNDAAPWRVPTGNYIKLESSEYEVKFTSAPHSSEDAVRNEITRGAQWMFNRRPEAVSAYIAKHRPKAPVPQNEVVESERLAHA